MFEFKSEQCVEIVSIEDIFISVDSGVTFKHYRNITGLSEIEQRILSSDYWQIIPLWEVAEKYHFSLNEDGISDYPKWNSCQSKAEADLEYYLVEATLAKFRRNELVIEDRE